MISKWGMTRNKKKTIDSKYGTEKWCVLNSQGYAAVTNIPQKTSVAEN